MLESEESADALVAERLSSHDVYFVFGCTTTRNARDHAAQIDDRASAAFVRLSETTQPHAGAMWEDADWSVSRDFLPRAEKLFARPQTTVRTLSALGLKFANGGSLEGPESGGTLSLKLRRHASSKIGLGLDSVPIRVLRLDVIHFASRVTLAVLRLQYSLDATWTLAQAAQVVLDCNHYLGHPLTHRADSLSWVAATHTDAPRLMGLVRALMIPEGHGPDAAAFQRLFAFTAMSTTAAPTDTTQHDLLLSRLARKHTVEYLPGNGYTQAFGVLQSVRFSVMPEGAALIVSTAIRSEFSAGYLQNSVPRVYLPAVLASLHEHASLRRMDDAIVALPPREGKARLAVLQNVLHDMLQFRLGYRMRAISGIAMHNEFHNCLRTALSLDGSLDRLTDDVQLVEQQLAADLHHRDEDKRRWLAALGTAAAAFTVLHEFFEIGIKLKWEHDIAIGLARFLAEKAYLPGFEYMVSQRHVDEVWGVVVPVVLALLAGLMSWWKKWTFPRH